MKVEDLPEPYIDCVIQHVDGQQRIGRLPHHKNYFELASYQDRKCYVVWGIENVVSCKPIEFFKT